MHLPCHRLLCGLPDRGSTQPIGLQLVTIYCHKVGKPGKLSVLHWLGQRSSTSSRPVWIALLVKASPAAIYKPCGNVHLHPLDRPLLPVINTASHRCPIHAHLRSALHSPGPGMRRSYKNHHYGVLKDHACRIGPFRLKAIFFLKKIPIESSGLSREWNIGDSPRDMPIATHTSQLDGRRSPGWPSTGNASCWL